MLREQRVQALPEPTDGDNFHIFRRHPGAVRSGNDSAHKTVFCRLDHPFFTKRNRADLTGKPELTENHGTVLQRVVAITGHNGCHQRKVGRRFSDAYPANDIDKDIAIVTGNAAMTMEHRQQQRQPTLIHPRRDPARVAGAALVHQRLQFEQ